MVVILMGKSAVGKDTVMREMVSKLGYKPLVSHTSRPKRDGEQNGVDYYFTTSSKFKDLICNSSFIEYRKYKTKVNGIDDIWYYGLRKPIKFYSNSEQHVVIMDCDGTKKLVEYLEKHDIAYKVVYLEANEEIRKERAMNRAGFDETEWDRRVKADDFDFDESIIDKFNPIRIDVSFKKVYQIIEKISTKI